MNPAARSSTLGVEVLMEIAVIIEPHDGGYRARCRHPVEAEATGHSRYDARLALEAILWADVPVPFRTMP